MRTWHLSGICALVLAGAAGFSGCAASKRPTRYVPLARRYVDAFNRHSWTVVCALGPKAPTRGFSGQMGCDQRMRATFGFARMRYRGFITGSYVGTVTTPAPVPYRVFTVSIGRQRRELLVTGSRPGAAIFLYDDCVKDLDASTDRPVGGCD